MYFIVFPHQTQVHVPSVSRFWKQFWAQDRYQWLVLGQDTCYPDHHLRYCSVDICWPIKTQRRLLERHGQQIQRLGGNLFWFCFAPTSCETKRFQKGPWSTSSWTLNGPEDTRGTNRNTLYRYTMLYDVVKIYVELWEKDGKGLKQFVTVAMFAIWLDIAALVSVASGVTVWTDSIELASILSACTCASTSRDNIDVCACIRCIRCIILHCGLTWANAISTLASHVMDWPVVPWKWSRTLERRYKPSRIRIKQNRSKRTKTWERNEKKWKEDQATWYFSSLLNQRLFGSRPPWQECNSSGRCDRRWSEMKIPSPVVSRSLQCCKAQVQHRTRIMGQLGKHIVRIC